MVGPGQAQEPNNVPHGGAPGNHGPVGDQGGHQETPDFWFRRTGRLRMGEHGWERGGRLLKVTYD